MFIRIEHFEKGVIIRRENPRKMLIKVGTCEKTYLDGKWNCSKET